MGHTSYEEIAKRQCDFIVSYYFLTPEEGGRKTGPPYQGYRCDFRYAQEPKNKSWIIHPEFLDDNGQVILDNSLPVPQTGFAKMWILNDQLLDFHRSQIKVGTKGYFVEGPHITAECAVQELVRLAQEPT